MDNQQIQVALEKHWAEGFSNMEDWINYNSRERECVFDASWASSTKFRERTFHTLCVEDTHWEILYAARIQVYDRKHSKLRVIVEHTVSRIKKFGIMGTKFRNKLVRYDHASDIVSGLVNFRIIMRTNMTLL
jgi:hypothetical protein